MKAMQKKNTSVELHTKEFKTEYLAKNTEVIQQHNYTINKQNTEYVIDKVRKVS